MLPYPRTRYDGSAAVSSPARGEAMIIIILYLQLSVTKPSKRVCECVCVCVCVYDELVVALCSGAERVFDLHTYICIYVCVLSVRHRSKYKKFLRNPNHRRSNQAKRRKKERKNGRRPRRKREKSETRGTKKKKGKRSFVSTQMFTKNRHQWNAQRLIAKVRDTGWRLPYWLRQWLRFI